MGLVRAQSRQRAFIPDGVSNTVTHNWREGGEAQGRRLREPFERRAIPSIRSAIPEGHRTCEVPTKAGNGAPHISGGHDGLRTFGKLGDHVDHVWRDDVGGRSVGGSLSGVTQPEQTHGHRGQHARHIPHGFHCLLCANLDATAGVEI